MAYRRTAATEARRAATHERIVTATVRLVAAQGWEAATVAAVARAAGVATGSVYRHVDGKEQLLVEAFRRAAGRELACVTAAAGRAGGTAERIEEALRVFADRALRGRRLAYALLAEPAGHAVEAERLAFRRSYRSLFAQMLADGRARGELAAHDPEVVAAVLTGALGEALVGPLAPAQGDGSVQEAVDELVTACLRALPLTSTMEHVDVVHTSGHESAAAAGR